MNVAIHIEQTGQLYSRDFIGRRKTEAIKELLESFCYSPSVDIYEEYNDKSEVSPIMISCFDNMKARKSMFNNWKKQDDRELFIDGRK